ncbi:hypothetical protein WMY93_011484 [Mugilogobius chulae]|uniref:G-protein coupled receptors family 1 profile domain-containing protein n=1 Tax=Mugilogobius chulae TaxID=88201 RepID=A0AAW0P8T6_9GOBI
MKILDPHFSTRLSTHDINALYALSSVSTQTASGWIILDSRVQRDDMNVSANITIVIEYRDSLAKAVTKNIIVVLLSISINYIDGSLVQTFRKHQIFYTNPRYILFCNLVINDMIQVILTMILFLLSYILYTFNTSVCCSFVVVALVTTENTPLNLACMAVECYIAICLPLRHAQICTFFHSKVFCLRETAFPNPILLQKRQVTYSLYLVLVWIIIFFTYFRILFTAKTASKDARKARDTIILHGFQVLLCMAAYAEHALKEALKNPKMNISSQSQNVYRDPYYTAVAKNVIVVTLGVIINYINGMLIHTFRKHQIFYTTPRYILFIHLVVNDMIQLTTGEHVDGEKSWPED